MVGTIVHRVHRGLSYKKILGYLSLTTVHWFFLATYSNMLGYFLVLSNILPCGFERTGATHW